jgi:arginase family enzyme
MAFRSKECGGIFSVEDLDSPLSRGGIYDLGDIKFQRMGLDQALVRVESTLEKISGSCILICVGGDHTFTFPILRSRIRADEEFHLVHIDQHLDLQLWGRFVSGTPDPLDPPLHSNFVSHILKRFLNIKLTQVGVQSFHSIPGAGHLERTDAVKYLKSTGRKITDLQAQTLSNKELSELLPSNEKVYISIDVDVLSWIAVSNTGYPAAFGISFPRLLDILSILIRKNRIIGLDLMEFGGGERTNHHNGAELCVNLLLRTIVMLLNTQSDQFLPAKL